MIDKIYTNALSNDTSYTILKQLCEKAPKRLVGSDASITAVNYMKGVLKAYKADTVFLQKLAVTRWNCSSDPTLFLIENKKKTKQLNILALGPSVSTDKQGISAEVIRIFRALDIKQNKTIRVVLFMDEEIQQRGGNHYAAQTEKEGLNHYAAIESDGGAFTPFGFSINAKDSTFESICRFKKYFEPYQAALFRKGYGGVDIQPLKKAGVPLIGLYVDCQRYFDFHHSANDTYDKVNPRELKLGAAAMASLVYLIDKHGIKR